MKNELFLRIITSIIILPLSVFILYLGDIFFIIFLILIGIILIKEWIAINIKKSIMINIVGIIYITIALFFSYLLRGQDNQQLHIFIWILTICICSDIGGYIVGKLIGGNKLTKISPNKTISGSVGSLFFSFFPLLFSNFFFLDNYLLLFNIKNILLTLIFSITCQIGDLLISYYKRYNNVKNIGNILPGHGGLFDRLDGIIFTILFASILNLFNIL
jgi:phosphatidate cytidylyltransferase|tara:strand:- start:10693 stop:11343 length:651 start_codon:yes stop_codon:yes gene_type:complete